MARHSDPQVGQRQQQQGDCDQRAESPERAGERPEEAANCEHQEEGDEAAAVVGADESDVASQHQKPERPDRVRAHRPKRNDAGQVNQ